MPGIVADNSRLTGGSITNNTCGSNGGVHVSGTASMSISGTPVVSGNTKNGNANNINLADSAVMQVSGALTEGADLHVSISSSTGTLTSGLSGNGTAENFTGDSSEYLVRLTDSGEAELYVPTFHTVTYNSPSDNHDYPMTQRVAEGKTAARPEQDPVWNGAVFMGWYLDETGFDFSTPITGDIELTAKWQAGYLIRLNVAGNGTVSVDTAYNDPEQGDSSTQVLIAAAGETVILTVTPAEGSELDILSVKQGKTEVAAAAGENGTYTFIMPAGEVTVTVTFKPLFGTPDFTMPAALSTIGESAFEGMPLLHITDADSVTSVGRWAFKDTGLTQISLPANCAIDADAFSGCGTVYIFAPAGGTTEDWCRDRTGIVFIAQ